MQPTGTSCTEPTFMRKDVSVAHLFRKFANIQLKNLGALLVIVKSVDIQVSTLNNQLKISI